MLLLTLASAAARADTWSDLWATHEQQAQKLLDSKRPAEAAPLFADPRRRAYAELQAGQYAKAAEHLAPFKDAESQYNRGNALAHTGKLQDALAAYDAALKQSPGSNDVLRNRELVAQALKQQQSGGQSQATGGQSGGRSNGQGGQAHPGSQGNPSQADGNAKSGSQAQPGNQGQQADRGQQGSLSQADNRPQPNSDGQSGSHSQQGNPSQSDGQAQAGNQSQAGGQSAGNRAQQASPSAGQGNATADDPGNATARSQPPQATGSAQAQPQGTTPTPAQAQASAREPVNTPAQSQSIAEAGQRGDSRADALTAKKALASADAPPQQPRSEQALALDQWLRGIPEDSGELLRRKFMIEHMMKQQGNEP